MSPGAIFERVYRALKEQLSSGRYSAGEHLEPAVLSDDLNASVTPVRDALHRLVGEGLVEAPRGDGFRTPLQTELGLRHLYRWNGALLELASRGKFEVTEPDKRLGSSCLLSLTESLFLVIAEASGNSEHIAAITRLNERLGSVRRVEMRLLQSVGDELGAIADALKARDKVRLRRLIWAYHRRRERVAPEVVAALHRTT
jgi:DNA-binding GntR family transcriptional regulator